MDNSNIATIERLRADAGLPASYPAISAGWSTCGSALGRPAGSPESHMDLGGSLCGHAFGTQHASFVLTPSVGASWPQTPEPPV